MARVSRCVNKLAIVEEFLSEVDDSSEITSRKKSLWVGYFPGCNLELATIAANIRKAGACSHSNVMYRWSTCDTYDIPGHR